MQSVHRNLSLLVVVFLVIHIATSVLDPFAKLTIADAVVRHTHGRWEVNTSALGGARMAVSWPRVLSGSRDQGEPDPPVSWSVPAPPARPGEA